MDDHLLRSETGNFGIAPAILRVRRPAQTIQQTQTEKHKLDLGAIGRKAVPGLEDKIERLGLAPVQNGKIGRLIEKPPGWSPRG